MTDTDPTMPIPPQHGQPQPVPADAPQPTGQPQQPTGGLLGAGLVAIGGFTIMAGSMMPWATARTMFGTLSIAGTEGDGQLFLLGGLVLVVIAIVTALWRSTWLGALQAIATWRLGGDGWWWLGIPAGLGTLIHIAGDSVTEHGCPILAPLVCIRGCRWRRLALPSWLAFRTGGWFERWVVTPVLVLGGAAAAGWLMHIS